jgi:hypothetical protein
MHVEDGEDVMKKYLRLAHLAKRNRFPKPVLRCIMLGAIDAEAFDDAHQIAVEYPRDIDDDLVRRLQVATLAALAKARKEAKKK